jgi:transcriptional regulator with XRE-family HTH domain
MSKPKNANLIGRNVARFRYQHGWTQNMLVAKIQIRGCYMTRNILVNIENLRTSAKDKQIAFLAEALGVEINDLFPQKQPVARIGFDASGDPMARQA